MSASRLQCGTHCCTSALLHRGFCTVRSSSDRCTSVASSLSFEASAVTGSPEEKDADPEDTKDDGVGSEDVKGDGGGCLFCAGDDNEIPGRACEAGRRDDDAWGRLSRSDHCDQGAAAPRRSVSRVTSTIVDVPMSMLRRVYAILRVGRARKLPRKESSQNQPSKLAHPCASRGFGMISPKWGTKEPRARAPVLGASKTLFTHRA